MKRSARRTLGLVLLLGAIVVAVWSAFPQDDARTAAPDALPQAGPAASASTEVAEVPVVRAATPVARDETEPAEAVARPDADAAREVAAIAPGPGRWLQVVDGSGRPVEGATVRWFVTDVRELASERLAYLLERVDPAATLAGYESEQRETDATGRVRVPTDGLLVHAFRGERSAFAAFEVSTANVQVELDAPQHLLLQVVDADGVPAPDVDVVFLRQEGSWFDEEDARTTDAAGLARFEHFGERVAAIRAAGRGHRAARAAHALVARVHTDPPAMLPIDLDDPPIGLQVLRLPPSGELEVLAVDDTGARVREPMFVHLFQVGVDELVWPGEFLDEAQERVRTTDGHVRFGHLGLERSYVVTIRFADGQLEWDQVVDGPRRAGERVTFRVAVETGHPILTGRLPLRGRPRTDWLTFRFPEHDRAVRVRLGEERRWRLRIDFLSRERLAAIAGGELEIEATDDEAAWGASVLLPAPFGAGEHDLGTLEMRPLEPLVEGVVLYADGEPATDVEVLARPTRRAWHEGSDGAPVDLDDFDDLEEVVAERMDEGALEQDRDALFDLAATVFEEAETGRDGRFRIHGRTSGDAILLRARPWSVPSPAVLAPVGSRDVVLRLARTGRVEGRLLLAPEIDPSSIVVRLEEEGRSVDDNEVWERGFFRLTAPAGAYDLGVRAYGLARPLATRSGIVVRSGEVTELDPLDLSGLRPFAIDFVGPDGQPVPEGAVQLRRAGDAEFDDENWGWFDGGRLEVPTTEPALDLFVEAWRYLPRLVRGVKPGERVELRSWHRVRVLLDPEGATPPPGTTLAAELWRDDGESMPEGWDETVDPTEGRVFWVDGAGEWYLEHYLVAPDRGTYGSTDGEPTPVLVHDLDEEQTLRVRLSPSLADLAREQLEAGAAD